MFKTDQDFVFDEPKEISPDYVISANDLLTLKVYSNKGADLVNFTASSSSDQGMQARTRSGDIKYLVEANGNVKLPEIGDVLLAGMSIIEAQDLLQEKYDRYHIDTYVLLQVTNNRVIVFPGTGGTARVIILENNNTTVIETLALAGGLAERANASKVKLIRKDTQNPGENFIYEMDMSTIDGIKNAQMIVQANDIVYVEPTPEIASEVLRDVSPVVQLISSVAVLYAVFVNSLGQ